MEVLLLLVCFYLDYLRSRRYLMGKGMLYRVRLGKGPSFGTETNGYINFY